MNIDNVIDDRNREFKNCEFKISIREKCQEIPFSEIRFDDDAEPKLMEWSGTHDELREWLSTPWGAMSMFEMRRGSPVYIYIPDEDVWLDVWPPGE